jgi:hypothetical protein
MNFAWVTEYTAIISLYSINRSVFVMERQYLFCDVRIDFLMYEVMKERS